MARVIITVASIPLMQEDAISFLHDGRRRIGWTTSKGC